MAKALRASGCLVVRVQSGSLPMRGRRIRGAEPGTPDLCVLCPDGLTVWLEIKTEDGKLSLTQKQYHEKMRALGHCVRVVRSVKEALEVCNG